MNTKPTAICREDTPWTPLPRTTLEVFQPPAQSGGQIADIIPFPLVAPADFLWPTARDSQLSALQVNPSESCIASPGTGGMTGVARPFEDAHITAKIQHDSRHSTYRMESPSFRQPVFVTVMPAFYKLTNSHPPLALRRSTAVLHGGHLVHHFGFWIMALLTIQLASAWEFGTVAGQTLGTGRYLHSATWLVMMLAFNLRVWFRYYGSEPKAFHVPGICLFLSATLPVVLLELLAIL